MEGLDGPIRPVLKPVLLLAFPAEEAGVTSLWVTEGEAQKPRRGSWNLRREATAQPRRVRLAGFGSRCTRTSLTLRASRCISVRPGAHQCVLVRPSASQSIQCPARVWDGRRGGSVRVRAVCWPGRPDADPGLPPPAYPQGPGHSALGIHTHESVLTLRHPPERQDQKVLESRKVGKMQKDFSVGYGRRVVTEAAAMTTLRPLTLPRN